MSNRYYERFRLDPNSIISSEINSMFLLSNSGSTQVRANTTGSPIHPVISTSQSRLERDDQTSVNTADQRRPLADLENLSSQRNASTLPNNSRLSDGEGIVQFPAPLRSIDEHSRRDAQESHHSRLDEPKRTKIDVSQKLELDEIDGTTNVKEEESCVSSSLNPLAATFNPSFERGLRQSVDAAPFHPFGRGSRVISEKANDATRNPGQSTLKSLPGESCVKYSFEGVEGEGLGKEY